MAGSADRDIKKVAVTERRRTALELRKSGLTYEQIAERQGQPDKMAARRDVMGAIKEIIAEPAAEVLQLELARLDGMFLALWDRCQTGEDRAITLALKIMERRAAFLGIDAPKNVQLSAASYGTQSDDPATRAIKLRALLRDVEGQENEIASGAEGQIYLEGGAD